MRRSWPTLMLMGAVGVLAACGGQGSRASSDNPAPVLTSHPPGDTPRPATTAATRTTVAPTTGAAGSVAESGATTTSAPAARRRPRPLVTHTASPTPTTTTPSTAGCAGVAGSTTTISETAGYRFTPATVTIQRCDVVKAVYADETGAPHNWQGKTWNSGDMTSSSNSSYSYRFTSTGTFSFFCSYHRTLGMVGSVTVD